MRAKIVGLAFFAIAATCASFAYARPFCLPNGVKPQGADDGGSANGKSLRGGRLFLDGSASMAGYISGSTADVRPIGDVISLVDRVFPSSKSEIEYYAFGSKIAKVIGGEAGIRKYSTIYPYVCHSCDNQESHIDTVLKYIARDGPGRLSMVVTDLWLDNRSIAGSRQVALGVPVEQILSQGQAIGVLGIRAPFKGKVFDFPSGISYAGATERPLFVLIVGDRVEVVRAYETLVQSGSPSFARGNVQFTLFSTHLPTAWLSRPNALIQGRGLEEANVVPSEYVGGLQQVVVHSSVASSQRGKLEITLDASSSLDEGTAWWGPLKASTRVWRLARSNALSRCTRDSWIEVDPLQGAWLPLGGARAKFVLSPMTARRMLPGSTYLVAGYLGVRGLQTPSAAAAWMRKWSFNASGEAALLKTRPQFVPTLNLEDLATAMETAVARAQPDGFILSSFGVVAAVHW
jgi:hypothetical protein